MGNRFLPGRIFPILLDKAVEVYFTLPLLDVSALIYPKMSIFHLFMSNFLYG